MPLDEIIGKMQETKCDDCYCTDANSDGDVQDCKQGQTVELYGSFCYPVKGHTHIAIIAREKDTKQEVWSKVCETGQMCAIPFSSDTGFICEDNEC